MTNLWAKTSTGSSSTNQPEEVEGQCVQDGGVQTDHVLTQDKEDEEQLNGGERRCQLLLRSQQTTHSVMHFSEKLKNSLVLAHTDNQTVAAYIKKDWWNKITLYVRRNVAIGRTLHREQHSDQGNSRSRKTECASWPVLSRTNQIIQTKWTLNQEVCDAVFNQLVWPNIDLFATRENTRLPVFFSPFPRALGMNALAEMWKGMHANSYPQFTLLPRVISKIKNWPDSQTCWTC